MTECAPSIPPVWVISLERAAERREFVTRHCEAAGLSFEILDAVDAYDLDETQRARYSRRRALLEVGRPLLPGEVGCVLSHLAVYERMIREGHPIVVVMEDDVEATRALNEMLESLGRLPKDWDLVTFHSLFDSSEPVPISSELWAGTYQLCRYQRKVFGTQCYAITAEAAERVLAVADPIRMPFDELLFRHEPAHLSVYGFEPKVVREGVFGSELEARATVDGDHLLGLADRGTVLAGKLRRRIATMFR